MKTDSLFYRLFQRIPGLPLELAGLDYSAEGYVFRSEEIKQTAFRLDGILIPPEASKDRPYVFVEAQLQGDAKFYARFFSEIFLYLRQYKPPHPWQAVVIYPDRATEKDAGLHFRSLLDLPEVHRIFLEDYRDIAAVSPSMRLVTLMVCPHEEAEEQVREALTYQDTLPMPRNEWLDIIETILVYKLPKLTREEIKQMIGLQDIELKQTRFYQDVFQEGHEEGRQEGKQEGRQEGKQEGRQEGKQEGRQEGKQEGKQEGRQEGRQEGELTIILRLLGRRFATLPEPLVERLRQMDAGQLEAFSEVLLDARNLDDINDWLQKRQ